MTNQRYSPEFKDEAVRQIVDRGYTVAEVSKRLDVSAHSLYKWVKGVRPSQTDEQAAALVEARSEVLKLRAQLVRTEEERDILKKAARYFAREPE
jgi:transposase